MRVLLIEDDTATAQSIELMLKSESFNVYTTDLGEEGVDLGKLYDYDIILLDLNLPDMSGFEVLRTLRVSKVKTPILILTGLGGIEDKVRGLGFGADDYMTKPFHKDELVARIHAIVRRSKGHAQSVITTGDLLVNLDTKTVEVGGQRVHLTGKEYQMLELLSLRKGTTLTKEMFLNHLYGGMDEPELKIIDVFICKLRKKLANASEGRNFIETVWGRGYVLREPHEVEERMRLAQHVAAAPHGLDKVAAFGSIRELLAQLADEDVDDLQLGLVHAAIEMVEEHFLGEGSSLAEREQLQHLVFLARQMHALAADLDRLGVELDDEIAGLNDRLGVALGTAHDGVDAGDQFVLVEGLGHVVVGADAETLDLVLDAGEAGEDQNGGLDLRYPKLLEHVVAGHVGQIEVEQDDVVIVEFPEIDAFFAKVRRVDVETLGFQHQFDRLRDGAVIFYQQYAHASPL